MEFLEFFQQFGQVVDSVVMVDRLTKRSRGFGFVTFATEVCACVCTCGSGFIVKRAHVVSM